MYGLTPPANAPKGTPASRDPGHLIALGIKRQAGWPPSHRLALICSTESFAEVWSILVTPFKLLINKVDDLPLRGRLQSHVVSWIGLSWR